MGGSAGGLDAYIRLLTNLPADMGVAIVIVNHITLMPTHLHEVLPRFTPMPVELITEDLKIEPNRVVIIPANRDLHVDGEEFHLEPISKPRGWPDAIIDLVLSPEDITKEIVHTAWVQISMRTAIPSFRHSRRCTLARCHRSPRQYSERP